jgi:hypothetical protein
MKAHECYHCKQWVAEGEFHDCWTTTEAALTKDLLEDLQDAYQRIRDTAVEFGEQRVYASGSCIMFARATCYFFVRPKRQWLELAVFLPRAVKSPLVKRVEPKSKVKLAHIIRNTHRDEVEAPLTDWLKEAYDFEPLAKAVAKTGPKVTAARKKAAPAKTITKSARPKATRARTVSKTSRKR